MTLSGSNGYTGGTTISAGTVQIGVANALPAAGTVALANAANTWLNLNNLNQTIGGLSGGGTTGGNVALGSGTLTVASTPETRPTAASSAAAAAGSSSKAPACWR